MSLTLKIHCHPVLDAGPLTQGFSGLMSYPDFLRKWRGPGHASHGRSPSLSSGMTGLGFAGTSFESRMLTHSPQDEAGYYPHPEERRQPRREGSSNRAIVS